MSEHVDQFVREIMTRFPPSRQWSEERIVAWGVDLSEQLGNEKPEILKHALKILVSQRSYASTPTPADVMKVVNQAVKEISARRRSEQLDISVGSSDRSNEVWSGERVKLAYEMLQTQQARVAVKEGWIYGYWTFVIEHGRVPNEREINDQVRAYTKMGKPIAGIKAAAKQFNEDLDKLARRADPTSKQLYSLAKLIVERTQRLSDIVAGKPTLPPRKIGDRQFAEVKASPDSKYADENDAEGRGWKGMTA